MGFECYSIGDLVLNAGTREVTRDGDVLQVPRLSFKLLLSLARHAPNVVSAEQLEEEVWQGLVVDRGTVNKRVLLLRKALGEESGDDPYIAVVRGSGYRLVAQVERVNCPADESLHTNGAGQAGQEPVSRLGRSISFWLLIIVAALSLYHGFQMSVLRGPEPLSPGIAATQVQAPQEIYSKTSIAVLPFVDLSEDQLHQYLGDGIAEEVINLLVGMDGLDVVARTSSFAFHGSPLTAVEIAPKLRAGTILEGSIRHADDRIRVTAQLIDAQSGYHIWSKNYDRIEADIFKVQDDIALNIAETLKLTLDESERINSRQASTGNVAAFEQYLKGRELFNNRIQTRAEGLHEALEHFLKAAELDPGFAKAHGSIALVSRLLTSYDNVPDKDIYLQRAETSSGLALELDPNSIDALSSLALVYEARGEIERAAVMYDQIRNTGSNDSNVLHWESMLHIRLGYFDEVIKPLREAYALEPFNEHIGWSLADALNFSGNPEQAMPILENLKYFSFRDYVLGLCAINAGDFPRARQHLRDVKMHSGVLPAVYADLIIDTLENSTGTEEVARALILAVESGELTKFVGFESLLLLGSPRVFDLGIDPFDDLLKLQIHTQIWNNWAVPVRQDPRFKDWVRALGNADFWRKYGWPDRCRPTGQDDFECI